MVPTMWQAIISTNDGLIYLHTYVPPNLNGLKFQTEEQKWFMIVIF